MKPFEDVELTNLQKTCDACPTQWEAKTSTGTDIYIRYRFGILSIEVNGTNIFEERAGGSLDGIMDTERMLEITGFVQK